VNITVGHGPDFVMKRGTVELFHTLQLQWHFDCEITSRNEVISDRSLFVVANQFVGRISKYEKFSMKQKRLAAASFDFDCIVGNVHGMCSVLLNAVHRIPLENRMELEYFFIQSANILMAKFKSPT
jgi:hypothetical protein